MTSDQDGNVRVACPWRSVLAVSIGGSNAARRRALDARGPRNERRATATFSTGAAVGCRVTLATTSTGSSEDSWALARPARDAAMIKDARQRPMRLDADPCPLASHVSVLAIIATVTCNPRTPRPGRSWHSGKSSVAEACRWNRTRAPRANFGFESVTLMVGSLDATRTLRQTQPTGAPDPTGRAATSARSVPRRPSGCRSPERPPTLDAVSRRVRAVAAAALDDPEGPPAIGVRTVAGRRPVHSKVVVLESAFENADGIAPRSVGSLRALAYDFRAGTISALSRSRVASPRREKRGTSAPTRRRYVA